MPADTYAYSAPGDAESRANTEMLHDANSSATIANRYASHVPLPAVANTAGISTPIPPDTPTRPIDCAISSGRLR
ncbi:hypothetical protein GPU89_34050 [Burkholderia cepacia]|nr:hypothetical protein [Burkholderia cepacia]